MDKRAPFALGLLIGVGACDRPMTAEESAKAEAMGACADRANIVFPTASNDQSLENKAGEMSDADLRLGADGHFVWQVPNVSKERTSPYLFTCAGNSRRRVIDFVELNGAMRRPAPKQVWSY